MSRVIRENAPSKDSPPAAYQFVDMSTALANEPEINQRAHTAQHPPGGAQADAVETRQREQPASSYEEQRADLRRDSQSLGSAARALRQLIDQVDQAQQNWLVRGEQHVIELAVAVAERIIRRQLEQDPQITLTLVREALELSSGSRHMRVALNPVDHETLGTQLREIKNQFARVCTVEIVQDAQVTAGGCRVETRWGVIDHTIETQLERIHEELKLQ